MTWTLAARIPISEEERENVSNPEYVGVSDKPFMDIYGGLLAIALRGTFKLFDWVEFDLSATYIGVLSSETPPQEMVDQLKAVHPLMGNVELDEKQVALALAMAENPK